MITKEILMFLKDIVLFLLVAITYIVLERRRYETFKEKNYSSFYNSLEVIAGIITILSVSYIETNIATYIGITYFLIALFILERFRHKELDRLKELKEENF